MERLIGLALEAGLDRVPEWRANDGALMREYTFADFAAAMEFVNGVAKLAESVGHHPDIDIRYSRVKLALITHDAGGLTVKDVEMAEQITQKFGR